ncbi:unnamed protein product, partial [marine sediment metagenome]
MKYRSIIFFLVAILIAGLAAYYLSRKPTSEELQEQRRMLLAGFDADKIDSVTIRTDDKVLRCERDSRDEKAWNVAEPIRVRADRWEVEGILNGFETAKKLTSIHPTKGRPLDLAQYGLDKPAKRVTFAMKRPHPRSWALVVGKEAGVEDAVFVGLENEEGVYSVKKRVKGEFRP